MREISTPTRVLEPQDRQFVAKSDDLKLQDRAAAAS
jgi:hypothetical protein